MIRSLLSLLLLAGGVTGTARGAPADLQVFGDVYLPERVLTQTASTADAPHVFDGLRELLETSRHNIVNFEGVATTAFVALEPKRHLLRMPLGVPQLLRAVGIDGATLANNHAMDFGFQGLFDSLWSLQRAGIATTGAGADAAAARRPIILPAVTQSLCIVAMSRTLPASFWAQSQRAGTAFASQEQIREDVQACVAAGHVTIAVFHWGEELSHAPRAYQRQLAHVAIDAGARAVLGHHPHVVQPVEFYKGRLIAYSLGNFAFGSRPVGPPPEALAVRIQLGATTEAALRYELVPLCVDNHRVNFVPRPFSAAETSQARRVLPAVAGCVWSADRRLWTCEG